MQKRNWGDTHNEIRLIIIFEKHVNCKLKQMKEQLVNNQNYI